jgi:hypothetical protein
MIQRERVRDKRETANPKHVRERNKERERANEGGREGGREEGTEGGREGEREGERERERERGSVKRAGAPRDRESRLE